MQGAGVVAARKDFAQLAAAGLVGGGLLGAGLGRQLQGAQTSLDTQQVGALSALLGFEAATGGGSTGVVTVAASGAAAFFWRGQAPGGDRLADGIGEHAGLGAHPRARLAGFQQGARLRQFGRGELGALAARPGAKNPAAPRSR